MNGESRHRATVSRSACSVIGVYRGYQLAATTEDLVVAFPPSGGDSNDSQCIGAGMLPLNVHRILIDYHITCGRDIEQAIAMFIEDEPELEPSTSDIYEWEGRTGKSWSSEGRSLLRDLLGKPDDDGNDDGEVAI